jgi:GNAT superfamily N-acetyltransferase
MNASIKKQFRHSPDKGLWNAIKIQNATLAGYFLDAGANPNASYRAKTMLMWAVDGSFLIFNILLARGAKPTQDTLKYAIKKKNDAVVKSLVDTWKISTKGLRITNTTTLSQMQTILMARKRQRHVFRASVCKQLVIRRYSREDLVDRGTRDGLRTVLMEDLGKCPYAASLLHPVTDLFLAFDANGKCVAGAAVWSFYGKFKNTLFVTYLCSSKTCSGAGTKLMRYLERYAKNHGMTHIGLESNDHAIGFYNKLGYSRLARQLYLGTNDSKVTTRSKFGKYFGVRLSS